MQSSSQLPLLMSQSIIPGLYGVLLYIVIIGVAVDLFIPSSAVVPDVATIVDVDTVISPSVLVSVVRIVINIVALVPLSVVVSAVVVETDGVELPPTAAVAFAAVITVDTAGIWVDVEPLLRASVVVSAVIIGIGVTTCTYEKRKIKNKLLKS